jgi:hypothetical protein
MRIRLLVFARDDLFTPLSGTSILTTILIILPLSFYVYNIFPDPKDSCCLGCHIVAADSVLLEKRMITLIVVE